MGKAPDMAEKLTAEELRSYALVGARARLAAIDDERDRLLRQFPELEDDEDEDEERLPRILYSDTKPRNGKSNGHSKPKPKAKPKELESEDDKELTGLQAETFAYVASRTETTVGDVAKRFDISQTAAQMRLVKLLELGKVIRPSVNLYVAAKDS